MGKSILFVLLLAIGFLAPMAVVPVSANNDTIVVGVDLAHGESDKYLDYIMGNITFVEWVVITDTITEDILSNIDILLIGQPSVDFSADEIVAIINWLSTGNKAIWIAADSDYGDGPQRQSVANTLLESIGSKLRIELGAIYDDVNNAQAFYRVLGQMDPDDIPELYTFLLKIGIEKPILFHGPSCVIWVDETGTPHDPLNETFDGLIRIAWSFDTAYYGDNQDPPGMLYEVGVDVNRRFLFVGAEYWSDTNTVIVASGESPYGDYEPGYAWEYYGVPLDGPKYVRNMILWLASMVSQRIVSTTVFEMDDPEGDDNGPGTYTYPTNEVFVDGAFDLLKFEVDTTDGVLVFKTQLRNLGGNPWNGPNGFCLQFIQIYVLTTREDLPINYTTIGANVEIEDGWHFAIMLAPGWDTDAVPMGQKAAIYFANGSYIVQDGALVVTADLENNLILAFADTSVLPDIENIANWRYAVLVLGYDGFGPSKVRDVGVGDPTEWNFGGGDANAIVAGVAPRVIDLLAPTADEQYEMLSGYTVEPATLAKVSLFPAVAPPTPTVTVTVTETVTETITETTTETVTETTTQTITETTTETATTTVTEEVPVTDWTTTIIIAIILLIIGFLVGWFVKRT